MTAMKTSHFNMVEILLALGVIAIGAISVLALLPYGLASTRDSVAESFAGDSADQFLHWFAAQAQRDWDNYAGDGAGGWSLPTKSDLPLVESGGEEWDKLKEVHITPNLIYTPHKSIKGLIRVRLQRGNDDQPIVDFSSVYRIWRDTVDLPYLDKDGNSGTAVWPMESAIAINLEASWPAELMDYNRRQRAVYRIEVFRDEP